MSAEHKPHQELVERVRAGLPFGSVNDPNSDTGAYAALSELEEQLEATRELLNYCHTGSANIVCERGGIGCSVRHSFIDSRLNSNPASEPKPCSDSSLLNWGAHLIEKSSVTNDPAEDS